VRFVALAGRLAAQRQPLFDAEAVLLVDDGQASDLNCTWSWITAWVPITSAASPLATSFEHLIAFPSCAASPSARRRRLARAAPSKGSSQPINLAEVLLGEDFGRRHQRALAAGVDGDGGGQRGHYRLAGTDIALQQPVHRRVAAQALRDLLADAALGAVSWKGSAASSCSCRPPRFGTRGAARSMLVARAAFSCDNCCASSSPPSAAARPVAVVLQRRQRDVRGRMVQELQACSSVQVVARAGPGASDGSVSERSARVRPDCTALRM